MAMRRCPICGEKYSETYRDCPFCEEEEALRDGEEIRRNVRAGRRAAHGRQYNIITPLLVVLILVMAGLLIYLLYGDKLAETFEKDKTDTPGTEIVLPDDKNDKPEKPDEPDSQSKPDDSQSGVMPEAPEETTEPDTPAKPDNQPAPSDEESNKDYETAAKLPGGLTISKDDFSLMSLGESYTIKVSGGSGSYRWISQDEGIASVDQNGKVTAVSGGTTNVLVTDGSKKAVCIVRIRASGSASVTPPAQEPATSGSSEDSGSGGSHTLNREDMTLSVGEKFQLKLTGVTTALTWSSVNPGVAEVSDNGTVKGVASGTTTVKVTWDGGSASCIVRVK